MSALANPIPRPCVLGPAAWSGGWLRAARPIVSPNQSRRPADQPVTLAVIHAISLPAGHYGGDAVERLFTNRLDWDAHPDYAAIRGLQVSAHFVIRRDGALQQYVSCDRKAWHAGVSSWRGVERCNEYSVGIELEGLEGQTFEPAQYTVLSGVLRALARRYPLQGVTGHEHIAPGRKGDPGAAFDWSALQARLGWATRYFPETACPGNGTG